MKRLMTGGEGTLSGTYLAETGRPLSPAFTFHEAGECGILSTEQQ